MAGAARKAGLITLNVEVRTPRDKAEEELIIISANKQREKTATQLFREDERLRAIYAYEGREKMLAVGALNNAARAEEKRNKAAFSEFEKAESPMSKSVVNQPFNVEEAYNEAMARTENANKSQMRNSAIESPHSEGQSTPSAAQSQPLGRQSTPKPALKKNARRPLFWFPKKRGF